MPRKPLLSENAKPSWIVREAVAQALQTGRVFPGKMAIDLWNGHRDEWADWTKDLCLNSLASMIRKVCKIALEQEENALFPGAPDHLPRAISVSLPNGEKYYISLRRATLKEAKSAVASLSQQIRNDIRKRNALQAVVEECIRRGARPDDLISSVLLDPTPT